ncbi:MAG: DNA primase noncatalytic subunit PriX, partial [Candidatus Bathyarchaeia archaeon]
MEGASIIENMDSEVSAKEYYLRKDFLEAMEPWLFGREIWITNAPRPLYASNTDELRDLIERYSPEGPGPFSLLFSVETFSDPPRLGTESPDSLRITWDFFLDIDAEDFQAAKLAASKALKTLRLFGVRNFLLKFSGRRGFHLVIPGLSLDIFGPGEFRAAYPRLAIGLARWFEAVMGEPSVKVDLGVYKPRQMMRAPYSLHERTGLASVPVEDPGTFKVEDARIEGARISKERAFPKGEAGEAEALLFSLRDWLKGHRREPQNGIKIVRQPLGDEKPGAYGWVEGLLDNPLDDGRHRLLWLVVAPYLVNVKRLSRHEAKTIARNWLTECNRKKPIEGDMNRLAAYYIDYAARTGIKPLSLKAIRTKPEYKELWEILS